MGVKDDEVAKILSLVENGKVTAEEGARLIAALRRPGEEPSVAAASADPAPSTDTPAAAAAPPRGEKPKGIGIYIGRPGKKDLKVRIPFGLFNLFQKWPGIKTSSFKYGDPNFDVGDLLTRVKQFTTGGEMFTFDLDDGKTVRVVAE